MNFHPILFSTPMVQAILNGSKTMTRRVLKGQALHWTEEFSHEFIAMPENDLCPYGKVGDVLWVRETSFEFSKYRDFPMFQNATGDYVYRADGNCIGEHKWKPSIYMPKEACRIFLEITSIRVERLQEINDIDATNEGIEVGYAQDNLYKKELVTHMDYLKNEHKWIHAKLSFMTLWQKINGKESWDANPWVWVIEFKRIEKPNNFLS